MTMNMTWTSEPGDVWIYHNDPISGAVVRLPSGVYETEFYTGSMDDPQIIVGTEHPTLDNACYAVMAQIESWETESDEEMELV